MFSLLRRCWGTHRCLQRAWHVLSAPQMGHKYISNTVEQSAYGKGWQVQLTEGTGPGIRLCSLPPSSGPVPSLGHTSSLTSPESRAQKRQWTLSASHPINTSSGKRDLWCYKCQRQAQFVLIALLVAVKSRSPHCLTATVLLSSINSINRGLLT